MAYLNQCQTIINEASETTEMMVFGVIGDPWDDLDASGVVSAIRAVKTPTLRVKLHSPGGLILEGFAIYNAFKAFPGKLIFEIDGIAASMASVIAMAGYVVMARNAFMMIHNPFCNASGDAEYLRKQAGDLDKFKEAMLSIYASKTGLDKSKLSDMLDAETMLTANEAKALGFADEVSAGADSVMNLLTVRRPAVADETLDTIKAKYPDIVAALMTEGKAAEIARISDVMAQAVIPGHEELLNKMALDGKSTGADAAKAILSAEAEVRKQAAKNMAVDAATPGVMVSPATQVTSTITNPRNEAECKIVWDKSADIRDEFDGDFECYKAYAVACAKGQVTRKEDK